MFSCSLYNCFTEFSYGFWRQTGKKVSSFFLQVVINFSGMPAYTKIISKQIHSGYKMEHILTLVEQFNFKLFENLTRK
jgi:hypothetical protein